MLVPMKNDEILYFLNISLYNCFCKTYYSTHIIKISYSQQFKTVSGNFEFWAKNQQARTCEKMMKILYFLKMSLENIFYKIYYHYYYYYYYYYYKQVKTVSLTKIGG